MSDVQQAPDWWLASDGKWYPPQSRPAPPPPPPPPFGVAPTPWATPHHPLAPTAVSQSAVVSSTLSGWLQALMWATGLMAVINGVLGLATVGAFENYYDARVGSSAEARAFDDWRELNDAFDTVGGLMILLWIAMFVLILVWMKKAHAATQRLWRGPRKWASGWTIGGWFIPFANFVIPKLVLNEIERIAKAPRWNGAVDDRWRHESTSTLGWLWWIGLSIGIIAIGIGMGLADELTASADELRGGYTMQALGSLMSAVALGLGAIYIRKISRRLSPDGMSQNP